MHSVLDIADKGLRVLAGFCLLGLFLLVVLQVALRYGLGSVPLFIEETARYALIWMTLLASAVAVRDQSHIRISLMPELMVRMPPVVLRLLTAVLDLVSLVIFLFVLWFGIDMMLFAAGQTSEGMQIPLSFPYSAVPVAFFFAALFAFARLLRNRL